ncbi:hypothetical protein ABT160_07970 [Streptomyces sp. NPDC001941]|uniref:hypothetical protein n=1 Tax=Streptomyces sp. NPDC001941 TaxID=3154659 RepID=UPI00331C011F
MGFLDRLTGTRRPAEGVEPRPREAVVSALFALNAPDRPWTVRYGEGDGAALVAEWITTGPGGQPSRSGLTELHRTYRILLKFVPAEHEVRALATQREVTTVVGRPALKVRSEHGRGGNIRTVARAWHVERGPDGEPRRTTYDYDSAEMRDPVREAVLTAGWTWRVVTFGRL